MDDWGDPWADAVNNPKHIEPLESVATTTRNSTSTSTPVLGGFFENESVWDTAKEADAWANATRDEPHAAHLVAVGKVASENDKTEEPEKPSASAEVEESGTLQPSIWDKPKNAPEEITDTPAETLSTDFTPPREAEGESGTATPSPAKPSLHGVDPSDSESTVRPGSAGTAASEAVPGDDAQPRQSQDLESRASTRRSASPSDDSHDEESSESRTSFEDDNRVKGASEPEAPKSGHPREDVEDPKDQKSSVLSASNQEVVEDNLEEDDFGDFGDFEEEFEQAPEAGSKADASPEKTVTPPPAAAKTSSVSDRGQKLSLNPDLTVIDKLFPVQVKVDKGKEIPYGPISSTSARKSWYRVTRRETLRKFESGNDGNSYVRVGWQESGTRSEVTKIVARWTTEDRINGRTLLGGKPGAVFGWDYPVSPASTILSHKRNASASTPKMTSFDAEVKQRPQSFQVPPTSQPFNPSALSGAAFGWNSSQTSLSAPPSKTSFEQQGKPESLEQKDDFNGVLNWASADTALSAPPHKPSFEKEMEDDSSLIGGSATSGWNALSSSPPASFSKPSFESKNSHEASASEADAGSSMNWGPTKSATLPPAPIEKKEESKPAAKRKSPFGWKLPQRTSSAPPPKAAATPQQETPENPWASSPPSPRPEAKPVAEPAPVPDFTQMKKKGKRLSSLAQGNASILLSPSPSEPPATPKPQRPGHFRRISLGFLPKSKRETAHKRSVSSAAVPTVSRVQTEPARTGSAMDNPWDATVSQDWRDETAPDPEPEAENPWTQAPTVEKTMATNPWTEHTPWASLEDLSKTEQNEKPSMQKPDLSINVDEPAEPEYDDWVNSPVSSPGLKGPDEDPWRDSTQKQEPDSILPRDSTISQPTTTAPPKPNTELPRIDTAIGNGGNEDDDWGDMESASVMSPSLAIPEPSSNPWQPTRNIPPLSMAPTPQPRRSQPVSPLVPESIRTATVSSPVGTKGSSWFSKTATSSSSSPLPQPPSALPLSPLNPLKSSSTPTESAELSIPKPSPTQPRIYPQSATTAAPTDDPWASADFSIFDKPSAVSTSPKGAAAHARTASTPQPPKPITFDAILQPSKTRTSPDAHATTFDQILAPSSEALELDEAERQRARKSAFGAQPRPLEEYEEFDAPSIPPPPMEPLAALDIGWGGDEWRGESEEGDFGDAVVRRFVGGLPDYGYMLR
ncbi:uncharacterized protein IWZ02DRAFT_35561 [Phyllosticta citriasiana]|uniref:uncharacterized protein n=1 Tax=Phyllosticta citriasiana TaxID=595635 RepID=UPI0030FDC752